MASMWGYQLPWDAELIGRDLTDLTDYFNFKASVTDQQIIDLLPSCLIKPFKYIMRLSDTQTPSYEKLKLCLYSAEESPCGIDRANGHARVENSKICPIKLMKFSSVDVDSVADDFTQANPDDSCHAYDITAYNFNQLNNGADWPSLNSGDSVNSKPDIGFSTKVELLEKPPLIKQQSSVTPIEDEDESDSDNYYIKGKENYSSK